MINNLKIHRKNLEDAENQKIGIKKNDVLHQIHQKKMIIYKKLKHQQKEENVNR